MDEPTARDYLARGLYAISQKSNDWKRREDYYRGDHDLPFAPEGVNDEYLALREMAVANWVALAMDAPIQRCRADGFRTQGYLILGAGVLLLAVGFVLSRRKPAA